MSSGRIQPKRWGWRTLRMTVARRRNGSQNGVHKGMPPIDDATAIFPRVLSICEVLHGRATSGAMSCLDEEWHRSGWSRFDATVVPVVMSVCCLVALAFRCFGAVRTLPDRMRTRPRRQQRERLNRKSRDRKRLSRVRNRLHDGLNRKSRYLQRKCVTCFD